MLTHLNAGHDIETPAQMCEAILLYGGVQSVSVTLCESIVSSPMVHYKIDGVSALSNIQISKEGIRAWRAYGVGPGRLIPQKFDFPSSEGLPSITVIQGHSTMMQHLDCGKQRALENETLFDKAALQYAEQLEGQATLVPVVSRVSMGAGSTHPQNMGWALKSSGSLRTRFTPAQKSYLTAKFMLGEQTGKKTDPAAVA